MPSNRVVPGIMPALLGARLLAAVEFIPAVALIARVGIIAGAALMAGGALMVSCAHPAASFRLGTRAQQLILVPPGVRDASVESTTLRLPAHPAKLVCESSPSGLKIDHRSVIVTRSALAHTTSDELSRWTAALEKNRCIPSGGAFALKTSVLDALPLDLSTRRNLQSGEPSMKGSMDIGPLNAFRVVSPVFRAGTPLGTAVSAEGALNVNGTGNVLEITTTASPDLAGYEIAWYDVRRREDGVGFRIVPRNAEVHIAGAVEKTAAPRVNQFDFGQAARFFRYFLMTRSSTDRNDYDIVLLSASTPGDLEARTEAFHSNAAGYLRSADPKSYAALTREFGVNPYIRVKLNGVETDLQPGETIKQAIEQTAGRASASRVPARLAVQKPHHGKLARMEWDHTAEDILRVVLEGGEEITW